MCRPATRTGSWSEPKPRADDATVKARFMFRAMLQGMAVLALSGLCLSMFAAQPAYARKKQTHRAHHHSASKPAPAPAPMRFDNSEYEPLLWAEIPGWSNDDQQAGFQTFLNSCKSIKPANAQAEGKVLGQTLHGACKAAQHVKAAAHGKGAPLDVSASARGFFENHFRPVRIAKLGEREGFVTGYYEPVIEGSKTKTDEFSVPIYRKPSNLVVPGHAASSSSFPNKGKVFRKIGRRKFVPYYDRAEIEDGALDGRNLEICWVKSQTDVLFIQIQGSARIKLRDGGMVRINYHAHNGHPYFPVGRELIDRGIVPKEEMSMQRIREWMDANPEPAKDVRRKNRSYVFFREVKLGENDEPHGAQGVALTPGRSIAVDKSLHVYGTPFYIHARLPLEGENAATPFQRLVVAQDTGSAIIGPARADIYFGAGDEAGRVSGRLRHNAQFVMLVPMALDPVTAGKKMPLPKPRPAIKIATEKKNEGAKPAETQHKPSKSSPKAKSHKRDHSAHADKKRH